MSLNFTARHFSTLAVNPDNISSSTPLFAYKLPDSNGKIQALDQYQGKIIVLNFWATWCPPCREEMPEFSEFYTTYQNNNVVVLGLALDEPKAVKDFLKESPVSYPIIIENDQSILGSQLGNTQNILPYTVIIDADGKIIKTFMGRVNKSTLESAIKPILQSKVL